ncbi:MAG TPA: rhodanese-like domain-containing protein [Clostridia bacterium]|nr:rhodanese-like domain-containing protein [Clostridia bacterium]
MTVLNAEIKKYFKDIENGINNLITDQDLYEKIDNKEDLFLLDIRKKEDFEENHLKGAFHSAWDEVGECIKKDVFTKDDKVIVICYSGQTAGQTVGILRSMGYNACALKGGMVTGSENDNLYIESKCETAV